MLQSLLFVHLAGALVEAAWGRKGILKRRNEHQVKGLLGCGKT